MARAIHLDPYMNFRFGLRLSREDPWIGFTAIGIYPDQTGTGSGRLELEKAMDEEFVKLMDLGKRSVNIGIFHITEEWPSDDPQFQIDLHGVAFNEAFMGGIKLDAMSRTARKERGDAPADHRTGVLLTSLSVSYDRCDWYVKETSLKGRPGGPVARTSRPVVM